MEITPNEPMTEFQRILSQYRNEDFITDPFEPLNICYTAIQSSLSEFDCYEEVLFHAAEERGILEQCKESWEMISKPLKRVRAVLSLIDEAEHDQATADKVSALAIMCGIGKSTAIGYKIKEVIERNDGHGLLVLTDRTDRLYDYVTPKENPSLRAFFDAHRRLYTIKEQENISEANRMQDKTPVLLMTIQRYFSLTKEEAQRYLKWEGGDRPLIIIDERPPLREIINITRKEINNVASALADGISDKADQVEKQWCREQWEIVRSRLDTVIEGYESRYPEKKRSFSMYKKTTSGLTEDDDRFFRFIRKNLSSLKQYEQGSALKQLQAIYRIEMWGCIYQSERGNRYSNRFSMMVDNQELVHNIGAKAIILDGTATIHPDYKQDYIHIVRADRYPDAQRRLDGLTLHFVNVSSSKRKIVKQDRGSKRKELIASYIQTLKPPKNQDDFKATSIPIFTYQNIEKFFVRQEFENVEHFGNIKGRNDFREHRLLAQIGLHRCDPLFYLTYDLYSRRERLNQLLEMPDEQSCAYIEDIASNKSSDPETMYAMMLEDIEQNFFRSAIRNSSEYDDIQVDYWIFCNTKQHVKLLRLAEDRYSPLGAEVIFHSTPDMIQVQKALDRNTAKPTAIQKFYSWLDTLPSGKTFTRADVIKGAGISASSFDHMREPGSPVYSMLRSMSIKKGHYKLYTNHKTMSTTKE